MTLTPDQFDALTTVMAAAAEHARRLQARRNTAPRGHEILAAIDALQPLVQVSPTRRPEEI